MFLISMIISSLLWADPQIDPKIQSWMNQFAKASTQESQKLLEEIGTQDTKVIVQFVPALKNSNVEIRKNAAQILGEVAKVSGKNFEVVSALLEMAAQDKDKTAKETADKAIETIGMEAFDNLFLLAQASNTTLQELSLARLLAWEEKTLPLLIKTLESKDGKVRKSGAEVLGFFNKQGEKVSEALLMLISRENIQNIKDSAQKSLLKLGKNSFPGLQKNLQHKDWKIRLLSLKLIGFFGKDAAEVGKYIVPLLNDANTEVATEAQRTYQKITGVSKEGENVVERLIDNLRSSAPEVRRNAVRELGKMGTKAGVAIPALGEYIQSLVGAGYDNDLAEAFKTLEQIGEASIPAVLKALKHPIDTKIRKMAAQSLGNYGSKGKNAIPALVLALEDQNYLVRKEAGISLSKLLDKDSMKLALTGLQNSDPKVRRATILLLENLGSNAGPEAKAALENVAKNDPDKAVQQAAKTALKKVK